MKTAMIWGAAGGIGQALVEELVARQWNVVAISRHDELMNGKATHSIYADVADAFSVQRATQATAFEVTSVDLWAYTAGDIIVSPVGEMKPDTWNRILSANLTGAYLAMHYSLPLLAPEAHIFFVSAISERLRLPGFSAYAAGKAGIEAFAESLRKEQRRHRVTTVRPSAVATTFWEKVPLKMPNGAMPAAKVAARMMAAYDERHSGVLDIA